MWELGKDILIMVLSIIAIWEMYIIEKQKDMLLSIQKKIKDSEDCVEVKGAFYQPPPQYQPLHIQSAPVNNWKRS